MRGRVPIGSITAVSDAGTITVRRPPGGYRELLRAYRVLVDGVRVAGIERGGRVQIPVPAGQHDVRAVLDGFGSPTVRVVVPAGGDVELTVAPGGSVFTALCSCIAGTPTWPSPAARPRPWCPRPLPAEDVGL